MLRSVTEAVLIKPSAADISSWPVLPLTASQQDSPPHSDVMCVQHEHVYLSLYHVHIGHFSHCVKHIWIIMYIHIFFIFICYTAPLSSLCFLLISLSLSWSTCSWMLFSCGFSESLRSCFYNVAFSSSASATVHILLSIFCHI